MGLNFKIMNKQKQNVAIALACGWKRGTIQREWGKPDKIVNESWAWTPPQGWLGSDSKFAKAYLNDRESGILTPPDYCDSLEAMHEAENILGPSERFSFSAILIRILGVADETKAQVELSDFDLLHANSTQRAEAFLKSLNLWEDE